MLVLVMFIYNNRFDSADFKEKLVAPEEWQNNVLYQSILSGAGILTLL